MKWQSDITKAKRIRATRAAFYSYVDTVLYVLGLPLLGVLALLSDPGWAKTLLFVEVFFLVLLPPLVILRTLWMRSRMIALTGTSIVQYELSSAVLRLANGQDKAEFPLRDVVVHKVWRDVIVCKRTSVRVGNKFVLFFDTVRERDKAVKCLQQTKEEGKKHGRTNDWLS